VKDGLGKREPVTHDIWIRANADRTQDSFQGRKASRPLLYFAYTPPQFAATLCGSDGQRVASQRRTDRVRGRIVQTLVPQTIELVMLVGMKFTTASSKPNRYHGFVEVELNTRDRYVAQVEAIEGPVHLVDVNEKRQTGKRWIVNSHIDLETYYYVY
jgi:hypothetical protein